MSQHRAGVGGKKKLVETNSPLAGPEHWKEILFLFPSSLVPGGHC